MTCEQYTTLLSQRMDGELSPAQAKELEAHLAVCPLCRALAEELSALTASLRDLDELEAPEGFVDNVMARVRAESAGPKVIPFFRRPQVKAMAGLAACAVLCVGLYSAGLFPGREISAKTAMTASAPAMDAPAAEAPAAAPAASAPAAAAPQMEDVCADAEMEMLVKNSQAADTAPAETAGGNLTEEFAYAVEPSAPSHYGFYGERAIRVTWGETPAAPAARILASADSLAAFLDEFPADDLSEIADAYPAKFFESAQLLAVVVEEPSGSVSHTLASQGLLRDSVTVLRHVPEEGTDDLAAWLILAETDAGFEDGKELTVLMETE